MKRIVFGAAAAFGIAASLIASDTRAQLASSYPKPAVTALQKASPASIIFIGNSFFYYNNGINGLMNGLFRTSTPAQAVRMTMLTISGSGIDWHDVDNYFRPNAIGRYSFKPDNSIGFNKFDNLFDVAVMMDCSQCPIHPDLKSVFHAQVKKNVEALRKHRAEPVLFMSWAYADKPEMTNELAAAYLEAGNANGIMVIPAGIAYAKSIAKKPELNLYDADKRHPSPAGSYLSAVTTYAALYNKSPVGLAFNGPVDKDTAAHLQAIAWETVQDFYGRK